MMTEKECGLVENGKEIKKKARAAFDVTMEIFCPFEVLAVL